MDWHIEWDNLDEVWGVPIVDDDTGKIIAVVADTDMADLLEPKEKARAYLLVAAPRLLKALTNLSVWGSPIWGRDRVEEEEWERDHAEALAAIAAAKGETS